MTLAERLAQINASELETSGPPEVQAIMERATADLIASGLAERALGIGAQAPDFELLNTEGTLVRSRDLREHGPLVLSFYRGVW
jgi:hypothetical protein